MRLTHAIPATLALVFMTMVTAAPAMAHKASDSFLYLDLDRSEIRIDVALRDMELLVRMDRNRDNSITWQELQARRAAITRVVEQGITLSSASGAACSLAGQQWGVSRHSDGRYVAGLYRVNCPAGEAPARLEYNLLFDRDTLHRGLLEIRQDGSTVLTAMAPDKNSIRLTEQTTGLWTTFASFTYEGVVHLLIGLDHMLFLLILVLPATLVTTRSKGDPEASLKQRVIQLAGIVTAFTAAHSLTLALSALGLVRLPIAWVETVIALSIALAALNVAWPILGRKTWKLAFGFGLIHGFGFASVLSDLTSGTPSLAVALAGFNLGVELGQLALLLVGFPLLYMLGHNHLYQRAVVPMIVLGVGTVSLIWVAERATQI